MGRVQGKVAFITGAARGQGRSHAVRLAEEGADIIAVDICQDVETVALPMATPGRPEGDRPPGRGAGPPGRRGRRPTCASGRSWWRRSTRGIAELGKLDIVVAKAGVIGQKGEPPLQAWADVFDTNLLGIINAVHAALPHLQAGASIIATGSTAAFMNALPMQQVGTDSGGIAYMVAKRMVSSLHARPGPRPGAADDPGQRCPPDQREHRHDAERADVPVVPARPGAPDPGGRRCRPTSVQQAMPIPWVEPVDISNAVLFLASDEARYVTGMQMRVDAGGYLKWYDFHA